MSGETLPPKLPLSAPANPVAVRICSGPLLPAWGPGHSTLAPGPAVGRDGMAPPASEIETPQYTQDLQA